MAVHQDESGNARAGPGLCQRHRRRRAGIIETTFKDECETDLFGEQSVLCGGATELVRRVRDARRGRLRPAARLLRVPAELKLIVDLMYEKGVQGMRDSISNTPSTAT